MSITTHWATQPTTTPIRDPLRGVEAPHKARVFKDEYSTPIWQVYYGPHWVGSAHSRIIAQNAARGAAHEAHQVCENNVTQYYLITKVAAWLSGLGDQWVPGKIHHTHTQWRAITRELVG